MEDVAVVHARAKSALFGSVAGSMWMFWSSAFIGAAVKFWGPLSAFSLLQASSGRAIEFASFDIASVRPPVQNRRFFWVGNSGPSSPLSFWLQAARFCSCRVRGARTLFLLQ